MLDHAGRRSDTSFDEVAGARALAFAARHSIERSCPRLLDAYERAWGPRPYVTPAAVAQRAMDLRLYLRQQHGAKDLAVLGADNEQAVAAASLP